MHFQWTVFILNQIYFTWLAAFADDAALKLVVAPRVTAVTEPGVRGLLACLGWACNTLVVDTPAEETF